MSLKEDMAVIKSKIKYMEKAVYGTFVLLLTHMGLSIDPQVLPMIIAFLLKWKGL